MRQRSISGKNGANRPADRARAALATRGRLSGKELRPTEDTWCEKSHRHDPDPVPDDAKPSASGEFWVSTVRIR
jgi:hypothetical protein